MQPTMPVVTKSKVSVTLAIVVGVILAASITAWGFLNYSKSGEAYVLESLLKMSESKTMSYTGTFEAKADIDTRLGLLAAMTSDSDLEAAHTTVNNLENYSLTLAFDGESDLTDMTNPATSFNLGVIAKKQNEPQLDLKLNLINKDKIYYARIPTLPTSDTYKDYTEFANKWIHFDYSELSKELLSLQEEFLSSQQNSDIPSEKDKEKIIESIKRTVALNPPIRVTKKYRTERLNGVEVRHFAFVLDPKNIEKIMAELAKNERETGVTARDVEDIQKALTKISSFNGEIWFGKKTLYPYKLALNVKIQDDEEIKNPQISLLMNMNNFNKPVTIQAPLESTSFEDIFAKVMEKKMAEYESLYSNTSTFGSPFDLSKPNENEDLSKDSDGDGIPDNIESILGTNPNNKDTDGDGYDDKTEINTGHDPLKR